MTNTNQCCKVCCKTFSEFPESGAQVTCDGPCGKAFHLQCTDLSMPLFNALAAKASLLWFCDSCRKNTVTGAEHRESTLQATVQMMFQEMQKLVLRVDSIGLKVDSLDENIEQLIRVTLPEGQKVYRSQSHRMVANPNQLLELTEELPTGSCDHVEPFHESVRIQSLISTNSDYAGNGGTEPQLPAKILKKVFHYLNFVSLCQIRLVSRLWKKIVDDDNWSMGKFVSKFPENTTIDRDFEMIPIIPATTLLFKNSRIITFGSWWSPRISEMLVTLELKNCKISLINLLEMLQRAPNLNSLNLGCGETLVHRPNVEKFSNMRLNRMETLKLDVVKEDEILRVFENIFPQLKDFELLSGYDECHCGVLQMIRSVKSLEAVSLPNSEHVLSNLAEVERLLKRVSISLPYTYNGKALNERLIDFVQKQPLLEKLSITVPNCLMPAETNRSSTTDERALDNKTLKTIFQKLHELKDLSLSYGLFYYHHSSYKYVIQMQTISCAAGLEYFSFNSLKKHSNDYQPISFSGARNPRLKELHLIGINNPSGPEKFGLLEYIEHAPNLRTITMDDCLLKSWYDLFAPVQLIVFRRLKLTRVKVHTNSDIDNRLEYFDELRYLELTECGMSGQLLSSLFPLCPQVEELCLSKMENVRDPIVLLLCQKMKQLRKLTIQQCPITDAAVKYIIDHGHKLEQLTIKSCELSPEARNHLRGAKILILRIET